MGKRGGRSQKKGDRIPKSSKKDHVVDEEFEDMDDDIDIFHKQRDVVPLNVNEDSEDSDSDEEMPVFDLKDVDESDENEDEEEIRDTGLAAKIARQQKFLKEKFGTLDDATLDDDDDEEGKDAVWSGSKHQYYNADNTDYEIKSSDDDSPAEEEAEVIRQQKEKAKSMSLADFGAEDTSEDESDKELTLQEIPLKGKDTKKSKSKKDEASEIGKTYIEVKKDLSGLSREEQMDVLYSSAPELPGLLSELSHAAEELETKFDPLLNKVKSGEIKLEGGVRYLELKKVLLLSYTQAIAFYLLLKSEGQAVRDHPVLDRRVEIKSLLDKTKELDQHIPTSFEELLNGSNAVSMGKETVTSEPDSVNDDEPSPTTTKIPAKVVPNSDSGDVMKVELLKENGKKAEKRKRQDDQVSKESMKMLKIRAALEEKLKQNGAFGSIAPKVDTSKRQGKVLNRQLETYDDFDDDTSNAKTHASGLDSTKSSRSSNKISQLIANYPHKLKAISGDDDLPVRDDIGERRRKHEVRVLASAGILREDEADDFDAEDEGKDESEDGVEEDSGSEEDFYEQVKQERAAKLAAKDAMYSRETAMPSVPETVDGKRLITYQMEKNRGLTRQRKKEIKNPRKKYKLKHEKAVKRRSGQVREVRKPVGPYGGEATGINTRISRSTRF